MSARNWILLFILFLVLVGVTAAVYFVLLPRIQAQRGNAEVVAVPTLRELPTVTATFTPTETEIPTDTTTPSPTPSETPSPTLTITASVTFTPSLTFTPSWTPTTTNTPTPTFTATPPATATPNVPIITSFAASSTNVAPNSTIVLRWQAQGDSVRIEVISQTGALAQTIPVQPTGETSVVVPDTLGRIVTYRLVVVRDGQSVNSPIGVQVACPVSWFFGNEIAPSSAGCPDRERDRDDGKFQEFERGVMIYVTADDEDEIFVLVNDGNRYWVYEDDWDGETTEDDDDPPDNLELPQEQFNWVYYEVDEPTSSWGSLLGWARDDIDDGDRSIQFNVNRTEFFIDGPDNRVYYLRGGNDDGNSGTWERIR